MVNRPKKRETKDLPDVIKLDSLSSATVDILREFGLEAPTLLNDYAIALEDALIEQVKMSAYLKKENVRLQQQQQQETK